MKCTTFTLLVLFSILQCHSQAPTNGLVDIFDGINVPNGTPYGNVTAAEDRNGNMCAVAFDGEPTTLILVQGVEEYSFHPDSSFSISLWYQGDDVDDEDFEELFVKRGPNTGQPYPFQPSYGLAIYQWNAPRMISATATAVVNQNFVPFPEPNPIWHHVVGVFEPGNWKLYYDNALLGGIEGSAVVATQQMSDISIGERFDGKLDDIYLYNRALGPKEVSLLYNANNLCLVGLPEWEQIDVNVFPNPSTGNVQIDLQDVKSDWIEIIDAQGRIVESIPIHFKLSEFDLKDFESGLYIIRFHQQGNIIGQQTFVMGS